MDKDFNIDLLRDNQVVFTIQMPKGGWRRVFPKDYIKKIRPIAETLAVMAGVMTTDYKAYLQEADAVYRLNQDSPAEFAWIRQNQDMQKDPQCSEMWNKLQVLLALKEK